MVILPATFDGSANMSPVGTGPFQLDSFTEGEGGEAVLSKFADYWDADSIQIAGLVLKDIRDPSARVNALQVGDIDGARIEPVDFDTVSSDTNLTVEAGDTVEVLWLNLDVSTTPELENPAVREAMSLAIDRQALIDSLAFGQGTATETLLPPFYWASSPNVEPTYDLEAARQLLADEGVEGFTFPILASSNQGLGPSVSQAVAGMLAEVGVTVNFEVAGDNLANRLYFDRDGGGVVGPWSGRPDPAQTIANTDGPGFVNIAKTSVPEIDALLQQANAAVEAAEREQLFHQIDELSATNHTSGIALFSPKTIFAYDSSISGLPIYVQGKHEFRDVCIAPS
jgi:peptide/nickel transport system substrate-binding protein